MTIYALTQQCLESFSVLSIRESISHYTTEGVSDEFGRFRVWAGNVSAHKTGVDSLQHRLRDSRELSLAVEKYLESLLETLRDLDSSQCQVTRSLTSATSKIQVNGLDLTDDGDDDDDGDHYVKGDVELFGKLGAEISADEALEEARELISCLLRLSLAIRNPAKEYQFEYDQTADEPHYIQLVQSKYPNLSSGLAQRLGKNISQRRQYMKHREQDLQKREQGLDRQAVPEGIARPLSSIALQHEAVRGTKDEPPIISSSTNLSEHLLSAAARSEEAADGRPFECCWCHHMIVANDNTEWKEHAFEDLLPYTCLKEDCFSATSRFSRRKEWQHHMEAHDRHWICPFGCSTTFETSRSLEQHLNSGHNMDQQMLRISSDACARMNETASTAPCQMCGQAFPYPNMWFEHVGCHLEELAMLAKPSDLDLVTMDYQCSGSASGVKTLSSKGGHGVHHDTRHSSEGSVSSSEFSQSSWESGSLIQALMPSRLAMHDPGDESYILGSSQSSQHPAAGPGVSLTQVDDQLSQLDLFTTPTDDTRSQILPQITPRAESVASPDKGSKSRNDETLTPGTAGGTGTKTTVGDDERFAPFGVETKIGPCQYYKNGYCTKGRKCKFAHDTEGQAKREAAELFTPVEIQKVSPSLDTKTILCQLFKKGHCKKGKKCKFGHNLALEHKVEESQTNRNTSRTAPIHIIETKPFSLAPSTPPATETRSNSRPLTPREAWSLYHYETHARACGLCDYRSPCDVGYDLSEDVRLLVCQHNGELCSTKPDSEGQWIRLEIPRGYDRTMFMLGVELKRDKRHPPIASFDTSPQPRATMPGSSLTGGRGTKASSPVIYKQDTEGLRTEPEGKAKYFSRERSPIMDAYIEPARTPRDDNRPRSKHDTRRHEVVEVAPLSKPGAGEPTTTPDQVERGNLYESDVKRPRREYRIEERLPVRWGKGQDEEWKDWRKEERRERRRREREWREAGL